MIRIAFYRQARRDGCIRTGIELDRDVLFGRFEGESVDFDPILTWYVDVEFLGESLPDQPEAIRRWLIDQARIVQGGLEALAEELGAGLDFQFGLRREIPGALSGTTITVTCRANRRFEARQMAEILCDIADHWGSRIQSLPAIQPATL